ncbi:MAG: GGDEF domain-containing protein [bacterium]|nr:GGDEF domain-containing protein [bacterium]
MHSGAATEKSRPSSTEITPGSAAEKEVSHYEARIDQLEREVRTLKTYKKMAVIDHLTGIFNRRYFDTRLEEETARMSRRGLPFSVALVDLDHFKQINDTHGHGVGDMVLREFAHYLKNNLRRVDVVCRVGGEEFAVIMPETDITAGLVIMERILAKLLHHPFNIQQLPEIGVSFSCGLVSNCQSFMDTGEILDMADQALYEAKRSGRSRVMARCC